MQHTAPALHRAEPPVPLPKRTAHTNVAAVLVPAADPGNGDWYTTHIYAWAHRQTDDSTDIADKVARVAVALVRNAHRWTRSGLPGGRTELAIVRGRFDLQVTVTDEGTEPADNGVCTFPIAGEHTGGLCTVADLAIYWDWEGGAGTPITVRALVDRRPL